MEFALSIGEAPDKMVQAFTKLLPEFVRYGTRAKDVFGAVAKQAKALGTEIEKLIGILKSLTHLKMLERLLVN